MALSLATYADEDVYRLRLGEQSIGDDPVLSAQLLGSCRLLEKSLGLAPGAFNSGTETLTFDGSGDSRLWLRDADGMGYFIQSVSANGIKLDTEQDGTFDGETYDPATADTWIALGPANASLLSEPYHYIDIIDHRTDRSRDVWPSLPRSVKVTATWGWAAVPALIMDLVVHRTHEIREGLKGGAYGELPSFDAAIPMRPNTAWMWHEVEQRYGRHVWNF